MRKKISDEEADKLLEEQYIREAKEMEAGLLRSAGIDPLFKPAYFRMGRGHELKFTAYEGYGITDFMSKPRKCELKILF